MNNLRRLITLFIIILFSAFAPAATSVVFDERIDMAVEDELWIDDAVDAN